MSYSGFVPVAYKVLRNNMHIDIMILGVKNASRNNREYKDKTKSYNTLQ